MEVKIYIYLCDDIQKKWCLEVCVFFIVECEIMMLFLQCVFCFYYMDSYDFGFYLDYQVLYVDFQDYKEDIRLEK